MALSNNKKIILSGIGIATLAASIVTPVVLLTSSGDENKQKDKENVEKLSKILKELTIQKRIIELPGDSTGKIVANNQTKIVDAIKKLITDEELKNIKIEVSIKNDVDISNVAKPIIITLKKGEYSAEIKEEKDGDNKGFKVKKTSSISKWSPNEALVNVKSILDGKKSKLIIINYDVDSKINENSIIITKIKTALEKQVGIDNLDDVTITPLKDDTNGTITNSGQGIKFKIIISADNGDGYEIINDWKVKRKTLTSDEAIVNVKSILDDKSIKLIHIDLNSDSKINTDSQIIAKIKTALETKVGVANLNGVTITPSKNDANETITNEGLGIGFKIRLSKRGGTAIEINNWKVKRKMTTYESLLALKKLFNDQTSKLITINHGADSTIDGNPVVIQKIINALITKISNKTRWDNLEGLAIVASDDYPKRKINPNTEISFGFSIWKDDYNVEIRDWKVKRSLTPNESIAYVKSILNNKLVKLIDIDLTSDSKINTNAQIITKIKTALEAKVGTDNLNGVTITPSKNDANGTISNQGQGTGFKITLSKSGGTAVEISDWKVKRNSTPDESIANVKMILDNKKSKLIDIDLDADSEINTNGQIIAKIKTALEAKVGVANLNGVTITPSKDDNNATITNQDQGIGFKITLSKTGGTPVEISDWKVKRNSTPDESIANVKMILDNKLTKLITINLISNSSIDEDSWIILQIKNALEEQVGWNNLDGVTITPSKDNNNSVINNWGSGVGFKITLSKEGGTPVEISDWKVKRKSIEEEGSYDLNLIYEDNF